MGSTLILILQFVFQLATLLFLARFVLQASGADFYNPLSQAIVKATDPVCKPLRAVAKPIGSFDLASLIVAWLISTLFIGIVVWLVDAPLNVAVILWGGVIQMLQVLTNFYFFSIIIVIIASFVAQGNYHPALALLHQLIEPLMAPFRRVIPPLGPLDLSPMLVILIIFVVQNMLRQVAVV